MPSLVEPDAPATPLTAVPSLRVGDQTYPLQHGLHGLGGRAADSVRLPALESQPRAATLTISRDGSALLQRTTASIVVRLDGEPIGIAPVELRHGMWIEVADCRFTFETDAPVAPPRRPSGVDQRSISGDTGTGARMLSLSVTGRSGATYAVQAESEPDAEPLTDAALIDVRTGARHPLPTRRIYIGRDDSCDVIVRGNSISRRHASIAPVAGGFLLRDESANGTLVNGVRVVGTYLLGNGDVVRIQDADLRVDLDGSAPPPVVLGDKTTLLDLSHIKRGLSEDESRAASNRTLTASLEIVRGPFTGACFQIERSVCSIGRGDENDVRIRDDTVSMAHATLLRKQDAWFVVDLRSMNGTYVDGSRVSGERELHPGARVRLAAVELVFRAIDSAAEKPVDPPKGGLRERLRQLLRSVMPPLSAR
jgi:pSer/pThr/pTyr-binding forkhead associated (FHA) protein